jgi:hypothetical protein
VSILYGFAVSTINSHARGPIAESIGRDSLSFQKIIYECLLAVLVQACRKVLKKLLGNKMMWKVLLLKVRQNEDDFSKPMFPSKNEQTNSISLL